MTAERNLIGVSVYNPEVNTPKAIKKWLMSGSLIIHFKNGKELINGPLYRLPATGHAGGPLRVFKVNTAEIGMWEAPPGTYVTFWFDDDSTWTGRESGDGLP